MFECTCGHVDEEHRREGMFSPCEIEGCDCPDFEQVER